MSDCYSSIIIKMQACVMRRLYLSRSSLKRLDGDAREVMRTALFAYIKAINDAKSCATKIVANARASTVDITIRTNTCIRNAPTVIFAYWDFKRNSLCKERKMFNVHHWCFLSFFSKRWKKCCIFFYNWKHVLIVKIWFKLISFLNILRRFLFANKRKFLWYLILFHICVISIKL